MISLASFSLPFIIFFLTSSSAFEVSLKYFSSFSLVILLSIKFNIKETFKYSPLLIKKMKRLSVFLALGIFVLVMSGVIAESSLPDDVQDFVKKVAEKKGIPESDINSVEEVNFSDLPKEINIQNIDDT